ncbi:MAG: hypothetical protein AAB316_09235 [Bacteroidota bacterium]
MEKHKEFIDRYFKIANPRERKKVLKTYMLSLSLEDLEDFVIGNIEVLNQEVHKMTPSEKAQARAILDKGIRLAEGMLQKSRIQPQLT